MCRVRVDVSALAPTPGHAPVWSITDDGTTISVDHGTAVDPEVICVQMIEPVELQISLGSWSGASRAVDVNGELVGNFDV